MMHHRIWSILLLGLSLSMALPGQANAVPTVFTDRAAFDAAVGQTTLETFDVTPPLRPIDPGFQGGIVTINNLLTISGDREAFNNSFVPGAFCFCSQQYELGARTVTPVLAFGLDIVSVGLNPQAGGAIIFGAFEGGGHGSEHVQVSQPQFLGFVFDTPGEVFFGAGFPNLDTFIIDNIAIKTVPEPSALLFLGVALVGFIGWHSLSRKFGQT